MLYFSAAHILFACLLELCEDCLTCANIAKIYQSLKLGKGQVFNWSSSLITPPLDLLTYFFSRSYKWYQSIGLHCFGLITIGGRWMSLLLGVLDIECRFLTESYLGHVCMVPEPVGSTHLRFGDTRVVMV